MARKKLTKDFKKFPSTHYLNYHYEGLTRDTKFTLRFLHETYESLNRKDLSILEIGGGPTVYQLFSGSKYAKSIVFTDFLERNLREVNSWVKKEKKAFSWKLYSSYIGSLEGISGNKVEDRLRKKIISLETLNILKPELNWSGKKFDVVSSHFCSESITRDKKEFFKAFRNIISFIEPDGVLVMSFLKGMKSYEAGQYMFPAYPVIEKDIRKFLKKMGFSYIDIESIDFTKKREHNEIMNLLASKKTNF